MVSRIVVLPLPLPPCKRRRFRAGSRKLSPALGDVPIERFDVTKAKAVNKHGSTSSPQTRTDKAAMGSTPSGGWMASVLPPIAFWRAVAPTPLPGCLLAPATWRWEMLAQSLK